MTRLTTLSQQVSSLLVEQINNILTITLNRPNTRNAMNLTMVDELSAVFTAITADKKLRAVVLQGNEENFCAGGDIKDMSQAQQTITTDPQAFYRLNRRFGSLITQVNACPIPVIAILEGAVLGGGFGLACVSDIAICHQDSQFGLPESSLGIPPAQIATFVVQRIGLTQTRRLALLGSRFNGNEAYRLGIVHFVCKDKKEIKQQLDDCLIQVSRCAPEANKITKQLIQQVGQQPLEELLDQAAHAFSKALLSEEGQEGTKAFMERRPANWVEA